MASLHRKGAPKQTGHDKARPLSHGVSWSFINTLVTKFMSIAVTAVVVHIVSPHDFGVYSVALVAYTIVSAIGELGLSTCISRRDMDPAIAGPVVTALSMISATTLALTMLLAAKSIATLLGAPDAATAIRILSLSVFLSSFTAVSSSVLVRDFRQGRLFAANAIAFFPANIGLILLAIHGDGAVAFAWSRVIGQVVAGAIMIMAARPWYAPRWNTEQAKIVLKFGLPLAGANILNYTLLNADYAFIGNLLGATMLGIYTLAFNVASWSTSALGGTIGGVAMPALSALRGDPKKLGRTLVHWSRLVAVAAFPMCVLTGVLAPELVDVLYGSKWSAAAPVLAILTLYGAVFVISLLPGSLLVATGRTGRAFIIQAVWLAALFPAIGFGVKLFGLEGAAMAHVAVILVIVIPMYFWALRPLVRSAPRLLGIAILKPAIAAVIAGAAARVAILAIDSSLIRLLVGGAVGALVYVILALPMLAPFIPSRIRGVLAPVIAGRERIAAAMPWSRVVATSDGDELEDELVRAAESHRTPAAEPSDAPADRGTFRLRAIVQTSEGVRQSPVKRPTVSIVITNYNYGRYLRQSMQSALDQRDVDVQLIVVDDASTDDSCAIVRELATGDPRVVLHARWHNGGPVVAFNDGLALATGDFVVRLDADDMLTPGSAARAIALAEAFPEVGLVYGHPIHFSDTASGELSWSDASKTWTVWDGKDWVEQRCRLGFNCITSPEVVMRTSVLREVGGMRRLDHTHDFELWMRIARHSEVGWVGGADQAWHRVHADSLSAREVDVIRDLNERAAAFELLFTDELGDRSFNTRMLDLSYDALANEALTRLTQAYAAGRGNTEETRRYMDYALHLGRDLHRLPQARAAEAARRLGPRRARRSPYLLAKAIRHRVDLIRVRRRWLVTGV